MKAGGDIAPSIFVKQSTSVDQTLVACGNTERAFGVSGEGQFTTPGLLAALGGSEATPLHASTTSPEIVYWGLGQYCLLKCGTAWSAGALLTSDADGKGKTASTGNPVNARALTAATTTGGARLVRVADGWAAP
jgi:hypothetical protein